MAALTAMRLGGVATVLALVLFVVLMLRRERRRRALNQPESSQSAA